MPTETCCKVTRQQHLWRKGQKVWLVYRVHDYAAYVKGRYRGKGRWIRGWLHWTKNDPPRWVECEIMPEFRKFLDDLG